MQGGKREIKKYVNLEIKTDQINEKMRVITQRGNCSVASVAAKPVPSILNAFHEGGSVEHRHHITVFGYQFRKNLYKK